MAGRLQLLPGNEAEAVAVVAEVHRQRRARPPAKHGNAAPPRFTERTVADLGSIGVDAAGNCSKAAVRKLLAASHRNATGEKLTRASFNDVWAVLHDGSSAHDHIRYDALQTAYTADVTYTMTEDEAERLCAVFFPENAEREEQASQQQKEAEEGG